MRFKLLVALVDDDRLDVVARAAREAGATGMTRITSASGEGLRPSRTFLGLDLTAQRGVLLLVVEEHRSRGILEAMNRAGRFESEPGSGIALQLPIEDAVGLASQIRFLGGRADGGREPSSGDASPGGATDDPRG